MWEPHETNHVERNKSMAEITRLVTGERLIHFATVIPGPIAAPAAQVLAELAAATSEGRKTA